MKYKKLRVVGTNEVEIKEEQLMILTLGDLRIRNGGELKERAVYLPEYTLKGAKIAEWIIVRDSSANLCAVPLATEVKG